MLLRAFLHALLLLPLSSCAAAATIAHALLLSRSSVRCCCRCRLRAAAAAIDAVGVHRLFVYLGYVCVIKNPSGESARISCKGNNMRQQGNTLRSCPTSRTLYARPLQEVEFENCAPLDILHTHGELAWSGCLSKMLLPSRGLSSSALLATPSCVLTCAVPWTDISCTATVCCCYCAWSCYSYCCATAARVLSPHPLLVHNVCPSKSGAQGTG